MYQCDNFQNNKCRYYEALIGTGEDAPTGMDTIDGKCKARDQSDSWIEVEEEDCDMLALVEGEEDYG